MHYLPLSLPFFSILVGLFLLLVALIQVGILRYAYMRLGVSSGTALLLLLGSLLGSYINIPLVELPAQNILSGQEVEFFGALFRARGDRLARHRDRDQCRRRAHSDADVVLSPCQEPAVGSGPPRDRLRGGGVLLAGTAGARRRHCVAHVRAGRHR